MGEMKGKGQRERRIRVKRDITVITWPVTDGNVSQKAENGKHTLGLWRSLSL